MVYEVVSTLLLFQIEKGPVLKEEKEKYQTRMDKKYY